MYIYLNKWLPLLVLPTGLLFLLLLTALLLRRRWPIWLSLGLFWLGSTPWVGEQFMRLCEGYVIRQTASEVSKAQAIIVLSEGRTLAPGTTSSSEWNDGDRFWGGIELYRAGKAPWLVFTGGWAPWQPELTPEGEVLRAWARSQGIPDSSIQVTGKVTNTAEEAVAVAALLQKLGLVEGIRSKTILLVTSAFHMTRAQRLFEQAGLEVLPYPVDFKVSAGESFNAMKLLPASDAWRLTEMAWRELLGRAWYDLRAELVETQRYLNKYLS